MKFEFKKGDKILRCDIINGNALLLIEDKEIGQALKITITELLEIAEGLRSLC